MVLELTADGIADAHRLHTITKHISDHSDTAGARQFDQRHEKRRCRTQRNEAGRPDARPRIDAAGGLDLDPGRIPRQATVTNVLGTPNPSLTTLTTLNDEPFTLEPIEIRLIEAGIHRMRDR